jgi:hypothetical protein
MRERADLNHMLEIQFKQLHYTQRNTTNSGLLTIHQRLLAYAPLEKYASTLGQKLFWHSAGKRTTGMYLPYFVSWSFHEPV